MQGVMKERSGCAGYCLLACHKALKRLVEWNLVEWNFLLIFTVAFTPKFAPGISP
jgi:hypothetical protein